MIKCLAIDDEPLALRQISSYIKKVPFLELAGECRSALDAMRILEKDIVDAVFVDINMPDLNGMDFVRSLQSPPLVVFTTAYSEYAIEGFKVHAIDYLLKPFGMDDFLRAANRVKAQYELTARANASLAHKNEDTTIFVKSDNKTLRIDMDDIRYVEGMSEYVRIHLEGRSKPLTVLLSMKKMEEQLPADHFIRIHRSYIVNMRKVMEVNKNRVIMDKDTYLPVSDNNREAFNNYIEEKMLGK